MIGERGEVATELRTMTATEFATVELRMRSDPHEEPLSSLSVARQVSLSGVARLTFLCLAEWRRSGGASGLQPSSVFLPPRRGQSSHVPVARADVARVDDLPFFARWRDFREQARSLL